MQGIQNYPDRSIHFGESVDMGMGEHNKAFPFIYAFVNNADDTWEANKGAGAATMDSIGPLVAVGATVTHAIRLDQDYNFRLLGIKYSVYYNNSGSFEWYDLPGAQNVEFGDYQMVQPGNLSRYIRVSVSMQGSDGRYLYGGTNLNPMVNGRGALEPLSPSGLQGYDYGPGQLRTPYFMPREGIIKLDITNIHATKPLYVTGMLHGIKVRL